MSSFCGIKLDFKILISVVFSTLLFPSCETFTADEGLVIAKAYDKVLYFEDIKNDMPKNVSPEDSLSYLKTITNDWVKRNVLLRKAEQNLSNEEKNVRKMVEDYKSSLLIFRYQNNYIKRHLDTVVTLEHLEEYYSKHESEFKLEENVVLPIYVKIPKNAKDRWAIRSIYKLEDDDNVAKTENMVLKNGGEYYNEDNWESFEGLVNDINYKLPYKAEDFLKYHKTIESSDSLYVYYVALKDYKLIGDTPPVTFIANKLKNIVINKRRIKLIKSLENKVYSEIENDVNIQVLTSKK